MANFITSCRIVCSAVLLFFPTFSVEFYIVYCLAGLTDMIDGTVARKTGTVSRFGSILDTAADIVFTAVCLMKILPALDIALWLWIWIAAIAGIKVINVIAGFVVQKSFTAQHTVLNKITGAVLFVLPLTLTFVDLSYSAGVVCTVATVAALHEGYLVIFKKDKSKTRQT